MSSSGLLALAALLFPALSSVTATPWPTDVKHATHRTRQLEDGATIESYHPPSTFESVEGGASIPLTKRQEGAVEEAAARFVAERVGVEVSDVHVRTISDTDLNRIVWLQQQLNGIPVINAVANVAVEHNSDEARIVSFGNSFVTPSVIGSSTPVITELDAIKAAEVALNGQRVDFPVEIRYFINDRDEARLAYIVQVDQESGHHWYEAAVDAVDGSLLSVTDFVAEATYTALPIWKVDPREGFETLIDPQDTTASPFGWHSDGTTAFTNTQGNNIIAFKGVLSTLTSESSPGVYDYPWSGTTSPTTTPNVHASRVNAFVVGNYIHDIAYRYGFTERTFNFQNNNRGQGGSGNDRVTISVQDASGTNNANFATPRDGQSGRMRMYIWTATTPNRDGDLENDIIVHEYAHGITNRMVGGGTGSCLQSTESGGMGEGWGDALSIVFRMKDSNRPDVGLGTWVQGKTGSGGIRAYPYSTSKTTNPYTYRSMASMNQVHAIGTVWSTILYSVYDHLVAAQGFDINARNNPASTAGNAIWLHLFFDSLLLMPCNPTFLSARDAWIQAEQNRYAGAHRCTVWHGFANRGLGVGAVRGTDSSVVPSGC